MQDYLMMNKDLTPLVIIYGDAFTKVGKGGCITKTTTVHTDEVTRFVHPKDTKMRRQILVSILSISKKYLMVIL
jgi:hypothetical protein